MLKPLILGQKRRKFVLCWPSEKYCGVDFSTFLETISGPGGISTAGIMVYECDVLIGISNPWPVISRQ